MYKTWDRIQIRIGIKTMPIQTGINEVGQVPLPIVSLSENNDTLRRILVPLATNTYYEL
jgi:hypothetical protein